MTYRYLIPAVLSAAGLLMTADAVHAQRGGGRGGGGGAHYGGGVYHSGPYYGGVRIGVGVGLYPYGFGYGYGYGGLVYDPYLVGPRVSYYPAPPIGVLANQQPVPSDPNAPAPPAPAANTANIRVLVPDPQAKVLFDGSETKQTGADRLFHTPALGTGTFTYRIRAVWTEKGKEVTQEAAATVTAGQTTIVDFTRPSSEPLPAPLPKKE
jgi:uncharacterized protein (TIGR03000 family)